jgi:hypothetical protein
MSTAELPQISNLDDAAHLAAVEDTASIQPAPRLFDDDQLVLREGSRQFVELELEIGRLTGERRALCRELNVYRCILLPNQSAVSPSHARRPGKSGRALGSVQPASRSCLAPRMCTDQADLDFPD